MPNVKIHMHLIYNARHFLFTSISYDCQNKIEFQALASCTIGGYGIFQSRNAKTAPKFMKPPPND
jgi:hypothetical protein